MDEIECVVVGAGVIGLATARALSPSAEIVDSHALMLAFRGEVEAAGATVVLRTPVMSGRVRDDGFELAIGGEEPTAIRYRHAAGLYAPPSPAPSTGCRGETIPPTYFCWGVYFSPAGRAPFRRLVYPVSAPSGLGVSPYPRSRGAGAIWPGWRVDLRD